MLAYRELDDALDLTASAAAELRDTRVGRNSRHGLTALLRRSIYSRLAGYEDLIDAERLRFDPAMRTVVGGRARDHTAASTSEVARCETEALTTREKLIKIGAKVVRHAKAVQFQEAVPRALFAVILGRIGRMRAAPSPV